MKYFYEAFLPLSELDVLSRFCDISALSIVVPALFTIDIMPTTLIKVWSDSELRNREHWHCLIARHGPALSDAMAVQAS